jgi:hypothetical protein
MTKKLTLEEFRKRHPNWTERHIQTRFRFNERRAQEYPQGRRYGLTPRESGHLYSDRDVNLKVPQILAQKPKKLGFELAPVLRDQRRHEREIRRGQKVDKYRSVNFYGGYAHVKVKLRNEDGSIEYKFITIGFDSSEVPTRQRIVDRVRRRLEENEGNYPMEVLGFTADSFTSVPDRTRSPEPTYPRPGQVQTPLNINVASGSGTEPAESDTEYQSGEFEPDE